MGFAVDKETRWNVLFVWEQLSHPMSQKGLFCLTFYVITTSLGHPAPSLKKSFTHLHHFLLPFSLSLSAEHYIESCSHSVFLTGQSSGPVKKKLGLGPPIAVWIQGGVKQDQRGSGCPKWWDWGGGEGNGGREEWYHGGDADLQKNDLTQNAWRLGLASRCQFRLV